MAVNGDLKKAGELLQNYLHATKRRGQFLSSLWPRVLLVENTPTKSVFELTVTKDECNGFGILHGGCAASLIDVCSTGAIMTAGESRMENSGIEKFYIIKYAIVFYQLFARSVCLLIATKNFLSGGVSNDLTATYVSPAREGDVLLIECSIIKVGKSLANTYTVIRNKHTGKIIAMGSHTKFNGESEKSYCVYINDMCCYMNNICNGVL